MIHDSDTKIITNYSKEKMLKLRSELVQKFKGIWIFLYKNKDNKYEIDVANEFGGRLNSNVSDEIKQFANDFICE